MIQLLRASAKLGLEPLLRGGGQAIGWFVGEIIIAVSSVTAPLLLVSRFGSIGTWQADEVLLLVGFALVVRGVTLIFSGRQVMMISRKIARGQLDHLLVQPQPLWRSLAAEGFSPFDLAITLNIGLGIFAYALLQNLEEFSFWWTLTVPLNLLSAAAIYVATQYLWGSLAFHAPQGAEEINSMTSAAMVQMTVYPLGSLTKGILMGLSTVLPVAFIAWIPVSGFLANIGWATLVTPAFAVGFCLLTLLVFRKGMKTYERRGVARYSDFGHRR